MTEYTSVDSLYQTILAVNNILVREVTPAGLFSCLAKTLQPIIGCDRCSLTIYDAESDTLSWFAQAEGISVVCMDASVSPLRGPLARRAISERKPIIIPKLDLCADDEAIRHMIAAGLQSSMAFPLFSRGKPIGALSVSFTQRLTQGIQDLINFMKEISTQVALAVENMLIHDKLNHQNEVLHQQVGTLLRTDDLQHAGSRFFYDCRAMNMLMSQIRLLAKSDAPVLICGETGTGKEFIARFIHRYSHRRSHNFVKVNCPALSPTLFESELFGHTKGAFTGAISSRMGRLELADKGSIFLDEIGDLDIMLQAKLLHVLQDARFERVGESRSIAIDIRCISATNADLHQMMHDKRFRRDFFYRLGVTTVQVPPLRDREGELVPMLHHLMQVHSNDMKCAPAVLHPSALHILEKYHWPGNVRELSNLLARLLILHPGALIGPEHIFPLLENTKEENEHKDLTVPLQQFPHHATAAQLEHPGPTHLDHAGPAPLAHAEKAHIEQALLKTKGQIGGPNGAASLLCIPRSTLQYKLKKHGIIPRQYSKQA